MSKIVYNLALTLLAASAVVSCSDKDLYDAATIEQQKKSEFTTNFTKMYGEVAPDQSWDLSNDIHVYSLSAPQANARKVTRAVTADPTDYLTINDWYEVDQNTVGWMTSTLKNAENHEHLGNPFYMVVPENVFYIVPIFEGYADFIWTLHIVVDDYDNNGESLDVRVWKKHENIEQKTGNSTEWTMITEVKGNTEKATAVRAKPIEIDLRQYKGKKMYLYLENQKIKNGVLEPRDPASSLAHTMLALDIPADKMPGNIDESYKKMIIACEDQAIYTKSDHDFNDVVFMIYGKPDIPDVKEIVEPIYDSFSKRYMIEDLGTTDDFDFNDVVVDVYDISSKKAVYKIVDGERQFLRWEDEVHSQEAIIRSLGGTLDITVKIGSTEWTKSASQYPVGQMVNTGVGGGINYNAELARFPIVNKDWDSEANNVSCTVGDKASGNVLSITFPKAGEVPMIIGFDVNEYRNWMKERQSIPSDWFTEEE